MNWPDTFVFTRVFATAIAALILPELLLDALGGPLFFRWLQGHAPVDKKSAEALADKIISAFTP